MITLFYLLGVFCFLHEVIILGSPKDYLKKLRILEELNKEPEDGRQKPTLENLPVEDKKKVVGFILFTLFYLAWTIIGAIFAGQWILFVTLLGFGFSIGFLRKRNKNNTRVSLKIIRFDSFVSSITLAFIVLNHFHNIL